MTPGAFEGRVRHVVPTEAYDRLMQRVGPLPYSDSNREVLKNIAFELRLARRPVDTEHLVETTRKVVSRSRLIEADEAQGRAGSMDPTELVNYVHHSILGRDMSNPPTDLAYANGPSHARIAQAGSASGVSI